MKRSIYAVVAIALFTANPVLAGNGNNNPGYSGHNPGYRPGHAPGYAPPSHPGHQTYYRPAYRYNTAYRGYGYPGYAPRYYYPYRPVYRPVGYGYYGYPYYQHHNNDNHNDSAAYLIGGLVVGSLLTNAYHNAQANVAPQTTTTHTIVGASQGRHLLRDLNGNCYEVTVDGAGNDLRTQLPSSQCSW